MKPTQDKLDSAFQYLVDKYHAEFAGTYGEPGYTNPERGIIFANWNNVPKGLANWLEKCGYKLEWSDEWVVDHDYDKAYRTSPDSYSWEPQTTYTEDGELLTPDSGEGEWIAEFAMTDWNQPTKCLPSWISDDGLTAEGFELRNQDLESGFHPGQTDDPAALAKKAFEEGANRVVFRKTENSQFYVRFECWIERETD